MKAAYKILENEFEAIRLKLIEKYEALGMKASGRWAKSLETRKGNDLSYSIYGEDYTEYLVNGRGPGKFPPIAKIEQWIKDKPIIADGITVSSLAFLIARKIAKEGTEYFKQGGTDLISDVITPAWIQSVIDRVSEFQINEFSTEISNVFEQIAA